MATTLDQGVVNSFLRGLQYPLDHEDLIHLAQINDVSVDLLEALRELPLGEFESMDEVVEVLEDQGYHLR